MSDGGRGAIDSGLPRFGLTRRFALGGELLVADGAWVEPGTQIGLNSAANLLHHLRVEVDEHKMLAILLKKVGDEVRRGEPVAYYMYLFGLGYREYVSPVNGTIISIDEHIGLIQIREHPKPLFAGVWGRVARLVEGYGILIEGHGAMLESLAGWGGAAWAPLHLAVSGPTEQVEPAALGGECRGRVVVLGALADSKLLHTAYRQGTRAVIAGGVDQLAADEFTAFAAAMTAEEFHTRYYSTRATAEHGQEGLERVLMPIIATDGLGAVPMRDGAWEALRQAAGRVVLVDARAEAGAPGTARPLIVISEPVSSGRGADLDAGRAAVDGDGAGETAMISIGATVRVLGGPWGGHTGRVVSMPVVIELETGLRVSGARVSLNGEGAAAAEITVPAANLELIGAWW